MTVNCRLNGLKLSAFAFPVPSFIGAIQCCITNPVDNLTDGYGSSFKEIQGWITQWVGCLKLIQAVRAGADSKRPPG